jgi:type VI secretion system secreted protein Hcp
MAVEMFLTIKGVTGEAQAKGFTGWIDIFSYSVGASNPTTVGTGTGSGAGKVDISSFSIQKTIDSATPSLFLNCASGKHFATAQLKVREAGGDAPVEFLVIDFTQVFIDSISWGGSSGGGKPSESVSFSMATIKFTYTAQSATGTGAGPVPFGWNLLTNVQL